MTKAASEHLARDHDFSLDREVMKVAICHTDELT